MDFDLTWAMLFFGNTILLSVEVLDMGLSDAIRKFADKPAVKKFFEEKSIFAIFLWIIGILTAIVGAIAKVLALDKTLASWLSHGLALDPVTKVAELKWWLILVVFFVVIVTASLVLMILWALTRQFVQTKDEIAFDALMGAVRQIRDQAAQPKIKAWESLTFIYLINRDLSGSLVRTSVMKAVDVPLHFWESLVAVEDDADPADSLAAVNYQVRDMSTPKRNLVYLPSENGKRTKKACLFFLPPLAPADSRKFEISYQWPGMFKRLRQNSEDIEFTSTTKDVLSLYRLEVYLQEGAGAGLDCKITGDQYPNQTLNAVHYSLNGWRGSGYIYEVKDVPAGSLHFVLQAKLMN